VNAARLLYEDKGFEMLGRTPGQEIAAEAGGHISDVKLGALFALLDELVFIVRYQCHYLTSCVDSVNNTHAVTYLRFCTGMLSTLWSIRILSSIGLDLNARTQLRYLYELAILWSRIQVDSDARDQFEKTSLQATNLYWHKFLSRRKSEKYLLEGVKSGSFTWSGATQKLDEIYEKLSLSAHPGFWGLYFETSTDFNGRGDNIVKRDAEGATLFTLSSTIFLSLLPFSVNGISEWPFSAVDLFEPSKIYPALPRARDWSQYCFELRKMLLGIGLLSFRFSAELAGEKW